MRLLIVSPYFAPSSLVGAQRMTSLAKYLADLGNEVHVIALTAETMQRTTGNSCRSTPPANVLIPVRATTSSGIGFSGLTNWFLRTSVDRKSVV